MLANRVREFSSTLGTEQNITLTGSTLAHSRMDSKFNVNDTVYYVIEEGDNYEIGLGTYLGNNVFQRATTPIETYQNDTLTTSSPQRIILSGNAEVFVSMPVEVINTFAVASSVQSALDLKFDKAGGTVNGDVTISGDVTITGTLMTQSSNDVNIGDSIITLNANLPSTSPPTTDGGFQVNRGNQTAASVLFREASDVWDLSHALTVQGSVTAQQGIFTAGVVDPGAGNPLALRTGVAGGVGFIQAINPGTGVVELHIQPNGTSDVVVNGSGGQTLFGGNINVSGIGTLGIAASSNTRNTLTLLADGTRILFGTSATRPNWKLGAQDEIDRGFNISIGTTNDSDPTNDTFTTVVGITQAQIQMSSESIVKNNATGSLTVSASNAPDLGANISMYAESHPTKANDIELRTATGVRARWHHSANTWDYNGHSITGLGPLLARASTNSSLTVTGGMSAVSGGSITFTGPTNASRPSAFILRSDSTDVIAYDSGAITFNGANRFNNKGSAIVPALGIDADGTGAISGIYGNSDSGAEFIAIGVAQVERLHISSTLANFSVGIQTSGFLSLSAATELTIAAGVITATKSFHSVDTESNAATDTLTTINGGTEGQMLTLTPQDSARDVTITNTGNIRLTGGTFTFTQVGDTITFVYHLGLWREKSRSING